MSFCLQKAGVDKALRGSDKMTKFARAANNLIMSIVRPCLCCIAKSILYIVMAWVEVPGIPLYFD